jgi:hypothetical protein
MEEVPKADITARSGIVIICYEGIKVGCGEAKPPKKSRALMGIDRTRVAEMCKRRLHLCL